MSLLESIHSPDDLKHLTPDQLPELAAEIRTRLIECCSETGGHIGASLGVVELTLYGCLRALGVGAPVAVSVTVLNRLIDYWLHNALGGNFRPAGVSAIDRWCVDHATLAT